MSPYEIVYPGGSVEHHNEEAGQVWFQRLLGNYERAIWLNPLQQNYWEYTQSIQIIRQLVGDKMFPLTLEGLDAGIRYLSR